MENLFKANWISKWILFLLLASSTIHSAIGWIALWPVSAVFNRNFKRFERSNTIF
jgi:hypothetical protein